MFLSSLQNQAWRNLITQCTKNMETLTAQAAKQRCLGLSAAMLAIKVLSFALRLMALMPSIQA